MAYYGNDTSANIYPCGLDFYIGRIGYGTKDDMTAFNTAMANKAGFSRTWSYWYVNGPKNDPNFSSEASYTNSDAANWGSLQATKYIDAWKVNTYVGGLTLFADIETGNNDIGGWLTNGSSLSHELNYYVFYGFNVTCYDYTGAVGFYSSPGEWSTIMGNTAPNRPGTVWLADWTESCSSCPTSMTKTTLAGYTPDIWQYTGSNCGEDLDFATSLPE